MASAGDADIPHVPLDPDVDFGSGGEAGPAGPQQGALRGQLFIVVALACGGALGAVARYALSLAMPAGTGAFPWGTFVINVSGSAVLGFLLVLVIEQFPRGRLVRPVVGTGFVGAYTTFSTFMVAAVQLVRDGHPETAVAYLVASLLAGLVAVWIGMTSARAVLRAERWIQGSIG